MANGGATGVTRLVNATRYSMAGLRTAWRTEEAFRQEALLGAVLLPVALWLGRTGLERALLIGALLLVLLVELLNTGIEYVVDRVGTEHHDLSGRAKDLASAAVFVSLVNVVALWGLVAWDRFGG